MKTNPLHERFMRFAIGIYMLTKKFPKETVYFHITNQILRSSSSPGTNHRAACRAKSTSDFINKLKMVEEELDETQYWLEYTNGIDKKWESETQPFIKEANELLSIVVKSIISSRKKISQTSK